MSRTFISGDCGVVHEPGGGYPGRDWRWFTGWGAGAREESEDAAWSALATALRERGYRGLATMAEDRGAAAKGGAR